jgi:glyoxylase-like metal-dependent hydrolase (beta-lactamase superfamily II)
VIGDYNPPMRVNKGFVSNMCYIDLGDTLVALDAGPTYNFAKEFYSLIKEKYPNKKVTHVVLSNFHDDRIQGASFFKQKGIEIVGHTSINNEIKNFKDKFGRIERITSKELYKNTKIVKVDTLVSGGYKIKGSKKSIEIIKPSKISEEKSDIAIYSEKDSFLFVGNMVFNGRMLNYRTASNVDGWIEALENLSKLNSKFILGGHGDQFDKDSYIYSLEYLKALRIGVKKAYEAELDMEDVKDSFNMDKFKNIIILANFIIII